MHDAIRKIDEACTDHGHPVSPGLQPPPPGVLSLAAALLNAAGDEGRLAILALLAERELCVTEITGILRENMSTISQRLRLLRSAGLVMRRRSGKHLYYSVRDEHVRTLVATTLEHASEDFRPSSQPKPEHRHGPSTSPP
ncbi:MAG: hypothetical protein GMKNLPBB_01466 [Myxococcota bacterium]|nr:hypothetical protein [Myxococcota bacterium]